MKTIIVIAAACRKSGALAIYKQFINHLSHNVNNHSYVVFVDESMPCPPFDGIEYIYVNLRKGFSRVLFDFVSCRKMLISRGIKPDLIISLQNTGVRCYSDIHQLIYYHQSIPFYNYNWNPFSPTERSLAFYKYIYPLFVKYSFKKTKVDFVAQIPFIKDGIIKRYCVPSEKVYVLFPDTEKIDNMNIPSFDYSDENYHFLYPAIGVEYKNHHILIKAIEHLMAVKPDIARKIRIHFTFLPESYPKLYAEIKALNLGSVFVFHNTIPHELLLSMLRSSCGLLFPSKIETLGLPLIEAAALGKPIIASDVVYAHEVLHEYDGVRFAECDNAREWAIKIENLCSSSVHFYEPLRQTDLSSWNSFFCLVENRLSEKD